MMMNITCDLAKSAYAAAKALPMRHGFYKRVQTSGQQFACPIGVISMCLDATATDRMDQGDGLNKDEVGYDPYLSGFISGFDGITPDELSAMLRSTIKEEPVSTEWEKGVADGQEVYECLFKVYGLIPKYDDVYEKDFEEDQEDY